MEISSVNQAYVFLAMTVCGALCTLVFDVFRAIRRYKHSGCGIIAVQDLIFWLIELVIVYVVAFRLNYARVRAYEIVALIMGSVVYLVTLSDYVMRFMVRVIELVVKMAKKLLEPLLKLWNFALNPVRRLYSNVRKSLGCFRHKLILRIKSATGALKLRMRNKKKPLQDEPAQTID